MAPRATSLLGAFAAAAVAATSPTAAAASPLAYVPSSNTGDLTIENTAEQFAAKAP